MSLNVYMKKDEMPKGLEFVKYNDSYFNSIGLIRDDEVTKKKEFY